MPGLRPGVPTDEEGVKRKIIGQIRVFRGGSWLNVDPDSLAASARRRLDPSARDFGLGLRLVRST